MSNVKVNNKVVMVRKVPANNTSKVTPSKINSLELKNSLNQVRNSVLAHSKSSLPISIFEEE